MREYPGLKPWDLDRMWPAEIDVLIDAANRRAKEQARKKTR